MRKTLQCPKCEGRKLWRIETMREHGHLNQLHPMAVSLQQGSWREKSFGWFEAFVCAECGFTELYANGLDKLEAAPDKGVHFIDTTPKGGMR